MNFPFQQPKPASAAAAPAPAASAPPSWGQAPAQAPAPAAAQSFWVVVNGSPVLMTMDQMRTQPPTTPACAEGTQTWLTVAALLPPTASAPAAPSAPPGWGAPAAAAPVGAPAGAPAWGTPAAAPQQPQYQYQAPQQQRAHAPQGNGVAPAGMFKGVENAQVHDGGGTRVTDGDYIGIYRGAEAKNKRDNTGSMVFFEVEIVQSAFNANDPTTHQCNRVGQRVSICVNRNDSFLSNFKEVALAISGFDAQGNARPDESVITEAESLQIVGPEQLYAGALVYLEVRTKPQRRDPSKTFTYINWWPCPRLADGSPDVQKLAQIR